jgi:hypothetical protein
MVMSGWGMLAMAVSPPPHPLMTRTNEEILACLGTFVAEEDRLLPSAETYELLQRAMSRGFANMSQVRRDHEVHWASLPELEQVRLARKRDWEKSSRERRNRLRYAV